MKKIYIEILNSYCEIPLVQNKINFIGICCGAEAHHVREMSVAIGKKPISMKYMPDMSKHFHHGTDKSLKKVNKEIKY